MSALTANPESRKPALQRMVGGIRNKLFLGLALLFAGAVIVGGTAIFSQYQQIREINRVIDSDISLSQIESQLLQSLSELREAERQFLLTKDVIGITAAKNIYISAWEDEIVIVKEQFTEIRALSGEESMDDDIANLEAQIFEYEAAYTETLALLSALGATGTGQNGDYERRLVALENAIMSSGDNELIIGFQNMRIAEIRFFATGEEQYLQQAKDEIERSSFDLTGANIAEFPDLQQEITSRIEDHLLTLDQITELTIAVDLATERHQDALNQAEIIASNNLEDVLTGADLARAEVDAMVSRGTITILALTSVAVILGIVLSRLISTRITAQSEELLTFFNALDEEKLDTRAKVVSKDELGKVAFMLNQVLDERGDLIQTTGARDQIEESIRDLIVDMQDAADGDLTSEATVSGNLTGGIADSFNYMLEQLREVITRVNDASLHLSSSANEIQTTAELLVTGSESQVEQILDTTAAVDEMSVSIQHVSRNAALSAAIGEQARQTADEGVQAVQEVVDNLDEMYAQVDSTNKLVEQLGTDAIELSDIVQLINAITERTSVLALNAAIQATARGKQGLGFDAVADQVNSLAEQSATATREIDSLIRLIQNEAESAQTAIVTTKDEVQRGLQLANDAGDRLVEIEIVSARLADLITSISQAAQQQARGSESIARSMNEIAEISQTTAGSTRSATESLEQLAQMADGLRQSMGRFKLN